MYNNEEEYFIHTMAHTYRLNKNKDINLLISGE